ncbi:hypothetical protein GCM10009536_27790 [Streptomyces thermocarboxydus]
MIASVGSSIFGSGTVSTRTSRFPCQVSAFIAACSLRAGRCVTPYGSVRRPCGRSRVPEARDAEPPIAGPIGGLHRAESRHVGQARRRSEKRTIETTDA